LEAFLLDIRDGYDAMNGDSIVKTFNEMYEEGTNRNKIKKAKMRLSKYGLWNEGELRLDDVEERIKKDGREHIEGIGLREYCRRLGAEIDMSDGGIRSKVALMKKYSVI
jgi:hypothetical protein|tara:strand:+ start:2229 stop:2555 length:327 start_codon:yes stop_codon:yes gene_type:complete